MDDRVLQLQVLKKEYKKLRAKAGWGWKCLTWFFGLVSLVLAVVTVFVLFHNTPWVQYVDSHIWEPFKAMVKLDMDHAAVTRLAQNYGVAALSCSLCLTALFDVLGARASDRTKRTEEYLNYRTLKLTLDTEKEEKQTR